jgi:hypothetical protein
MFTPSVCQTEDERNYNEYRYPPLRLSEQRTLGLFSHPVEAVETGSASPAQVLPIDDLLAANSRSEAGTKEADAESQGSSTDNELPIDALDMVAGGLARPRISGSLRDEPSP